MRRKKGITAECALISFVPWKEGSRSLRYPSVARSNLDLPLSFFFQIFPRVIWIEGIKRKKQHLFAFIWFKREKIKWNERRKKKWNIRVPVYRFNLELISKIRSNSDLATIISSNYIFVQLTRWRVDACGYSKPDNNSIN